MAAVDAFPAHRTSPIPPPPSQWDDGARGPLALTPPKGPYAVQLTDPLRNVSPKAMEERDIRCRVQGYWSSIGQSLYESKVLMA
ncbi:hypothetical protein Hypma_000421 [Hypsizygus marmoreus]|uniref:Uncharacterized protein n=1 Tax=Hypsizygus marmoreus TaxID=39966 RepID=A0A369JCK4_HYPMA|nr:hypothetical protein Hypma_000421 [Hypsizygus marmoreus]